MPDDQLPEGDPSTKKAIPKFEDFADTPTATRQIPKFEDFADTPKKKDGGTVVLPNGGTNIAQSTSPVLSTLPLQGGTKLNTDPFDVSSLFTKPTFDQLDPIEKKEYNAQFPALTTPEKTDAVVKGIIDKRKIPGVRITNAQKLLSDDMDANPDLYKDVPNKEVYKQQVIEGNGADSNISATRYYNQRSAALDDQIKSLQEQQYVASNDFSVAGPGGEQTVKAPNYDQLQAQIDSISNYKSFLGKSTGTIVAYNAAKEIPLPAGGDLNAKREANRQVGLKIQDLNSPFAAENKRKNIASDVEANRHPELVDIENYRLESDGLNARQFAINADYNNGKIDHDQYISQSNDIANQSNQLFDLHPQAKKVMQAQALGQIIQENRATRDTKTPLLVKPVSVWENVVNYGISEDDIRTAGKKMGLTEAEIKTQINNKDDIPGTSFLANVYNKFVVHSGEDLIAPITSLLTKGRLRTDAEVEAEKFTKDQAFQLNAAQSPEIKNTINVDPKSADYLQEVANPNAGHHNWGYGTLNSVGDAVGTLGQLWLATELTGTLGDAALGSTIGADVVGVNRTATGLSEAKAFTTAQKNLFGNVAGMMLTGYNENKAASKEFIGEAQGGENAQNLYALTRSMETGLLFGMLGSPANLVSKSFGREAEQAAAKKFADLIPNGIENMSKESWSNYLKDNLAARIAIDGVKENVKATTMMSIDQAVGIGTQAMFNPQSVDAKNLGHDILNTGIHNFLTFAPISFFGAGVTALNNPHLSQGVMEKEAIYRAGLDPVQYAEYVNGQVQEGTLQQTDANKRIQLVNTMADIQKGVPQDLSRSEKIEFANNLLFENKYQSELKGIKSEPLIARKQAQIKDLQARQEEIINNSTGIEKDANGNPIIKLPPQPETISKAQEDKNRDVAMIDSRIEELNAAIKDQPDNAKYKDQLERLKTERQKVVDYHDEKILFPNNENISNATKNDQAASAEAANSKAAKGSETISDNTQAEDAKGIVVDDATKALLEPHNNMPIMSEMKTDAERLKFISEQAQNISPNGEKMEGDAYLSTVDAFGDKLVTKAIEAFPEEKLTGAGGLYEQGKTVGAKITPLLDKMNKAEYINENELNSSANDLYDILDRNEKSNLSKEQKESTVNLVEPLIQKLEDYEFRTKTETSTVTEKIPVQVARETKTRREIKPALEQIDGSAATITKPDGTTTSGQLRLNDGNYELVNEQGEKVATLGEKAINDRDVILPPIDKVENPIEIDKDGNVKSITLKTRDGNLLTVNNPEKALDLAIQLSANVIDVPMEKFDTVYKEIQKEVSREVPVKDLSTPKITEKAKEPEAKITVETQKEKPSVKVEPLKEKVTETPKPPVEETPPAPDANPESDGTVLSFKGLQDVADEFGLNDVTSRDRKTDVQLFQDAKDTMEKWVKDGNYSKEVNKLVTKSLGAESLNDEQRVILQQHIANVRGAARIARETFGITSPEYNDALNQLRVVTNAGLFARRTAGAALRVGNKESNFVKYSAEDMMAGKMESLSVDVLTDKQKTDIEKVSEQIEKSEKIARDKYAAYEAEIAKYKAEAELNRTNSKGAKKTGEKKTRTDYVSERKSLYDQLKAARDKAENKLADKGVQQMGVGFTLTPEMAKIIGKIVRSHVDELGANLKEVTTKTFNEIKDLLPGATEKDIHDVISGKYNEGKTKSQLQQDLKDIQTEAKLINQLADLENGVEPKDEKRKVNRNQRIKELRDQIKDYRKAEADSLKEPKENIPEEEKKLDSIIKRNQTRAAEIQSKLANGDFAPDPRSPFIEDREMQKLFPKKYKEALDSYTLVENLKHEYEVGLQKDLLTKRSWGKKYIYDPVKDVIGTSKALRAGIDFSALFIQNIVPVLSHPIENAPNVVKSFVDLFSAKQFERRLADLHNSKDWDLIKRSGLDVTEPKSLEAKNKEEFFNRNLFDKLNLKVNGKKISLNFTAPFERQFTSLGNNIRVDAFRRVAEKFEKDKKTFDTHPKDFTDLAKLLNTQTGRGTLPDFINKSTEAVNTVIWSPRLMASRLNLLGLGDVANPVLASRKGFYAGLTPAVRKRALVDMAKFAGAVASLYGLAGLSFGAETDNDPESVTFGDIKVPGGTKSYNMLGGFSQYVKLAAILGGGERHMGKKKEDVTDAKGKSRADLLLKFLRGKVTPAVGVGIDIFDKKDFLGRPVDPKAEALSLVTPLSMSGLVDDMERDGALSAFTNGFISATGINVKDSRDFSHNKNKKQH